MVESSSLSRRPAGLREEAPVREAELNGGDALPAGGDPGATPLWSCSPVLERLREQLDQQIRTVEQAKRVLEERLAPFQRHLVEQRHNVERGLRQLEARIAPLRQYLEGQAQNLERVAAHVTGELKDQFGGFERFLDEQRGSLRRAGEFLDEQPRPLFEYLRDEQRTVEQIFRDLEERMAAFAACLQEQQKVLDGLAEARVLEDYGVLARFCAERQAVLRRYATAQEYRPEGLFADLEAAYRKYEGQDDGKSKLLRQILEQARQADLRLQEALKPLPLHPSARPGAPLQSGI